mmetsp:Transcript_106967/g.297880  ORF Transcript_106967/g.297880 Transcript_106967/m.297880 type:complete len:367 (-) Transcript_106967:1592-2692(-)
MDVHEEPPDARVDPDVINAQPHVGAGHAGPALLEQAAVADGAGGAHVPDVRHLLRADVALPAVHPGRVHQVPGLPVARVLRVVLGHEVELCLLPLVVCAEVCLALGTDVERADGRAAAVLLPQGEEQAPRDRDEGLGGHLRAVAAQELVRAEVLEVVQRPGLAHRGQSHVPVLADEDDVELLRRAPVEVPQGRPVVVHLLGYGLGGRQLRLRQRRPRLLEAAVRAALEGAGGIRERRRRQRRPWPPAWLPAVQQVLPDLRLHTSHVVLEGLAVQAATPGGCPLVEEDVGLGPLDLLRADEANLQVVELVPLLGPPLVLAVGDVMPSTHRADVLDQPDQPVLDRLLRGLIEEAGQVKRLSHWKCHDA